MKKNKPKYLWVINIFIAVTILLVCGVAYLTLVHATILVPAEREKFSTNEIFDVRHDATGDALYGDVVMRDYTLSGQFPVSKKTTKTTKAGGMVTIVNNYNKDQSLIATTRILSKDNKLFRITDSVYVAAGKSVEVFAEADKPGDEYLVAAGTFTIPGLWEGIQDKIFATTEQPMNYNRQASAVVTADDVKKAETELTNRIISQAVADFAHSVPQGFTVSKDQLTAKTISITTDPAVGKEATTITANLSATVSGMLFNPSDVQAAIAKKVKSELPDANSFLELIPEEVHYSIENLNLDAKSAQLKTQASAWIKSSDIHPELDKKALAGKTMSDAQNYLKDHEIQDAEIKIWPGFIPWMPVLADHISVQAK